jgi:hypothetical protein
MCDKKCDCNSCGLTECDLTSSGSCTCELDDLNDAFWDYGLIKTLDGHYAICEVYYNNDEVAAYCPILVGYESEIEAIEDLQYMLESIKDCQPLDAKDFQHEDVDEKDS